MRYFAINLDFETKKKEHILAEAYKHGLSLEIVPAVYGKALSEEELSRDVIDHHNNYLTKGEIGCALSHISIYKKMIDENIPLALVLEDDAVLLAGVNAVIKDIEGFDDASKPNVYQLTLANEYYPLVKHKAGKTVLHKVFRTHSTAAYIINNAAAHLLYKNLYPVQFVADVWQAFIILFGLKVYAVLPPVVRTDDDNKEASTIEADRSHVWKERYVYYRRLLASKRWYWLKKHLLEVFARPFTKRTD